MHAFQTKIMPPQLRAPVLRERLFRLLDGMADHPVIWISSPAGAGKTTLVASYVTTRELPFLWYRVDEADGDVASFFYYMAEAAKKLRRGRARPLPLLSPEFRQGTAAFAHHYFESLFGRMTPPGVMVIDNYQDIPEDAELHEILKSGLKLVPERTRVL